MYEHGWRTPVARYVAPIAFLAAVTAAVLLVRAGLKAGSDQASTPAVTVTSTKRQFYRVRSGDTLSTVAERFNTTLDDLVALNPQIDPNGLKIGERLRIH